MLNKIVVNWILLSFNVSENDFFLHRGCVGALDDIHNSLGGCSPAYAYLSVIELKHYAIKSLNMFKKPLDYALCLHPAHINIAETNFAVVLLFLPSTRFFFSRSQPWHRHRETLVLPSIMLCVVVKILENVFLYSIMRHLFYRHNLIRNISSYVLLMDFFYHIMDSKALSSIFCLPLEHERFLWVICALNKVISSFQFYK